jgi:hypothetical protein
LEIGGSTERLVVASAGARFGFGVCGSINETASVTALGGAAGSGAGAAFGAAGLRPVIGVKADRVAGTAAFSFGFETGAVATNAVAGTGAAGVATASAA